MICESVTNCHMSCGVGHAGSGAGSTTGWHSRRFTMTTDERGVLRRAREVPQEDFSAGSSAWTDNG